MIKVGGPLFSLGAHGWLGRCTYGKVQYRDGVWTTPKYLVHTPYPLALLGTLRFPYRMHMWSLRPYPPFISMYYNPKGWCYQMRRTWHGIVWCAEHAYITPNPRTTNQQIYRIRFADAVSAWQGLTEEEKAIYNTYKYPRKTSGYNKFIIWYIKSNSPMLIYWGTLQKALGNPYLVSGEIDSDIGVHAAVKDAHHSNKIAIVLDLDGAGSALTTGIKADLYIPFACTIVSWHLFANQTGDIQIDVWKDTYANFPPTVDDTITGDQKPLISSGTKNQNTGVTHWSAELAAGDVLRFNVDSIVDIQRAHLAIVCNKS